MPDFYGSACEDSDSIVQYELCFEVPINIQRKVERRVGYDASHEVNVGVRRDFWIPLEEMKEEIRREIIRMSP